MRAIPSLHLVNVISRRLSVPTFPHFLCPCFVNTRLFTSLLPRATSNLTHVSGKQWCRLLHIESSRSPVGGRVTSPTTASGLPWVCPGCGAYTQIKDSGEAGHYSISRKPVRDFVALHQGAVDTRHVSEAKIFAEALESANQSLLENLGLEDEVEVPKDKLPPVCNRCHGILHHHKGLSIIHPTIQSIQDIISESPHKYNHIYHVIDAADFPLSVIPQLQHHLSLTPQRSRNRRAKIERFYHGRKAEMSFIITRSDLLAPIKDQVDALMPYLIQVLRDTLGSSGKGLRLGNVRCVSSSRGWWTKQVKEEIWNRGGGGWMVGKANVGKSSLFEAVFPKGRNESASFGTSRHEFLAEKGCVSEVRPRDTQDLSELEARNHYAASCDENSLESDSADFEHIVLLPPLPVEIAFPAMPLISHLSGTTASPIRLPFGSGKGELIDLPGLSRGSLEECIQNEYKTELLMKHRIRPAQHSIKPGQSLLISNLIRITPTTPDLVFLACPFVPLDCHVTSTTKAIEMQTQKRSFPMVSIAKPEMGERIRSAGTFEVKWDVTKQRSGPLTAPAAVGLRPQTLHFVVFSIDILIEGCGWVELAVQVRKKALEDFRLAESAIPSTPTMPMVEVFSPDGKNIGTRRPMNAWILGSHQKASTEKRKSRPRRSMKGVKKNLKRIARSALLR